MRSCIEIKQNTCSHDFFPGMNFSVSNNGRMDVMEPVYGNRRVTGIMVGK